METAKKNNKPLLHSSPQKDKRSFFSFEPGTSLTQQFFQPKLTVNSPSDVFEKQADAVAEQIMNNSFKTEITPVTIPVRSSENIQRDETGPREEEQDPLTGGLEVLGESLMDNNPLFLPFLNELKLRLWDQQPSELKNSIIGFGVADALIL